MPHKQGRYIYKYIIAVRYSEYADSTITVRAMTTRSAIEQASKKAGDSLIGMNIKSVGVPVNKKEKARVYREAREKYKADNPAVWYDGQTRIESKDTHSGDVAPED